MIANALVHRYGSLVVLVLAVAVLAACGAQPATTLATEAVAERPSDTPVVPADTPIPPTNTPAADGPTPEETTAPEAEGGLATIPHQVQGREACVACHAEDDLAPFPTDHAGRASDSCQACHEPSGRMPSLISHDLEGRDDCIMCHAMDGNVMPAPSDHVDRGVEICQVCHLLAPEAVPEPERPSGPLLAIPHDVDGKEECLGCHGADAVAPYAEDHAGRENDQCQACHLPGERVPALISHTLAERGDCRMCHAADAFQPFPSDHRERGNELCLLCHSTVQ